MKNLKSHTYTVNVNWTGNNGKGTESYLAYERSHLLTVLNKPELHFSSDPSFRGDPGKYNPEEMLVYALSACHMLWYLHLCAVEGVNVIDYRDEAIGEMAEEENGAGRFTKVTLHPKVDISKSSNKDLAMVLHDRAHEKCFIANSVNFPVSHKPQIKVVDQKPC